MDICRNSIDRTHRFDANSHAAGYLVTQEIVEKKWAAENGIELFSGLNVALEQYARPGESIAFYSRETYSRESFCRSQLSLISVFISRTIDIDMGHTGVDCKFLCVLVNRKRLEGDSIQINPLKFQGTLESLILNLEQTTNYSLY